MANPRSEDRVQVTGLCDREGAVRIRTVALRSTMLIGSAPKGRTSKSVPSTMTCIASAEAKGKVGCGNP